MWSDIGQILYPNRKKKQRGFFFSFHIGNSESKRGKNRWYDELLIIWLNEHLPLMKDKACKFSNIGTPCSAYNTVYCLIPKFLQQSMSNYYNDCMVNNNINFIKIFILNIFQKILQKWNPHTLFTLFWYPTLHIWFSLLLHIGCMSPKGVSKL